jgi:hypothetical protein
MANIVCLATHPLVFAVLRRTVAKVLFWVAREDMFSLKEYQKKDIVARYRMEIASRINFFISPKKG